ncbi:hypothetical protein [Gemmatimonas sp.]|jgi:hypothetical protein|uniref:hypothetical protein n=1 Tax=Gemmatimonas sp. TaxID=1962908 RepID=UPI0037C0FB12
MQPSNAPRAHIPLERLAAFDEAPFTADEAAHLSMCTECRNERDAVAQVVAMAGALGTRELSAEAPRLVEFEQIMAELGRAPVVEEQRGASSSRAPLPVAPRARRSFAPLLRRAAAALLLVGGGAVWGRLSSDAPEAAGAGAGALASRTDRPFADQSFASVDAATAALNQAQRDYERASLWLASNDSTVRDPEVFRARLAALDQMMEASRVALRDAPQDPVLNHYYLAASSAREATLQALLGALPVDKTIERY